MLTGWDLFGYAVPETQGAMAAHLVLQGEMLHGPANGPPGMLADPFGPIGEILDGEVPPQSGTDVAKAADFAAPALSLPWQIDDHALRAMAGLPRATDTFDPLAGPRTPASTRNVPPSNLESLPPHLAFQLRAAEVLPAIVSPTPQPGNDSLAHTSLSDGIARPDDRGALSPLLSLQRSPDFAGATQGSGEGASTSPPRAALEGDRSLPGSPKPLSVSLRSNEASGSLPDDLAPPSPELAGVLGNVASTDVAALERGLVQFLAQLDALGASAIREKVGFGWSKVFVTAAAFGIVALEMARRRLQRAFPEVVALATHADLTWSWLPNDPGLPEDKEL